MNYTSPPYPIVPPLWLLDVYSEFNGIVGLKLDIIAKFQTFSTFPKSTTPVLGFVASAIAYFN